MMTKLQKTLSILEFYNGRIKAKLNFLKQNSEFKIGECIRFETFKILNLDIDINEKVKICKEKCIDKFNHLHSYFTTNLIEINSFYDEYHDYFIELSTDDLSEKAKIAELRKLNKELLKKVDFVKIKRMRNNVLAHNLRDKKNNNRLSIDTLKEVNNWFNNLKEFINCCEIINQVFINISLEFKKEIIQAKQVIREVYNS